MSETALYTAYTIEPHSPANHLVDDPAEFQLRAYAIRDIDAYSGLCAWYGPTRTLELELLLGEAIA